MSVPASTWSPLPRSIITPWMAAMPEEKANAPTPDSSEASVVSRAFRVGLPLRE